MMSKHRINHSRILFFICFFVWALGVPRSSPAASIGPVHAVDMLQKGVDAADVGLAETYIDLDSVAAKAALVAVADESVRREAGKHPAGAVVLLLGASSDANEALRDMLASEVKEYFRYGVASGAFAGTPKPDATPYRGIFGKTFRGGVKDKKTLGPAKVKKSSGDSANVVATLTSGMKGKTYPLEMVLQNQNGTWRIVEIANLPELIRLGIQGGKQ